MTKSIGDQTLELNTIINVYQKTEHISSKYIVLILVELVAIKIRENLFKD